MTESVSRPRRQAAFGFIFASALMNSISFGLMIPILPNLIRQLAGGDTAAASDWNVAFATVWGRSRAGQHCNRWKAPSSARSWA